MVAFLCASWCWLFFPKYAWFMSSLPKEQLLCYCSSAQKPSISPYCSSFHIKKLGWYKKLAELSKLPPHLFLCTCLHLLPPTCPQALQAWLGTPSGHWCTGNFHCLPAKGRCLGTWVRNSALHQDVSSTRTRIFVFSVHFSIHSIQHRAQHLGGTYK